MDGRHVRRLRRRSQQRRQEAPRRARGFERAPPFHRDDSTTRLPADRVTRGPGACAAEAAGIRGRRCAGLALDRRRPVTRRGALLARASARRYAAASHPVDCRAAVREPQWRSGAGLCRRRRRGRADDGSGADWHTARHLADLGQALQRHDEAAAGHRARARCGRGGVRAASRAPAIASSCGRSWSGPPTTTSCGPKRYESEAGDILAWQGKTARAIAGAVHLQIRPDEQRRLARARPVNPEAYFAYLQGRFEWSQRRAGTHH